MSLTTEAKEIEHKIEHTYVSARPAFAMANLVASPDGPPSLIGPSVVFSVLGL